MNRRDWFGKLFKGAAGTAVAVALQKVLEADPARAPVPSLDEVGHVLATLHKPTPVAAVISSEALETEVPIRSRSPRYINVASTSADYA